MWGFSRETQKISFSVLSEDDLKAIHWATLDVLERTGVKVYSDKCLMHARRVHRSGIGIRQSWHTYIVLWNASSRGDWSGDTCRDDRDK